MKQKCRKSHSAGVCCIASSPQQEHCLVTGSYDEHIRFWDTRRITQPVEIAQVGNGFDCSLQTVLCILFVMVSWLRIHGFCSVAITQVCQVLLAAAKL
jgi:WD40 repeat protein